MLRIRIPGLSIRWYLKLSGGTLGRDVHPMLSHWDHLPCIGISKGSTIRYSRINLRAIHIFTSFNIIPGPLVNLFDTDIKCIATLRSPSIDKGKFTCDSGTKIINQTLYCRRCNKGLRILCNEDSDRFFNPSPRGIAE